MKKLLVALTVVFCTMAIASVAMANPRVAGPSPLMTVGFRF